MTSPYLEKPLRTEEQVRAQRDCPGLALIREGRCEEANYYQCPDCEREWQDVTAFPHELGVCEDCDIEIAPYRRGPATLDAQAYLAPYWEEAYDWRVCHRYKLHGCPMVRMVREKRR